MQVFCDNVDTLARRGPKQVVPEGLYDALIAVVDLLQKLVSVRRMYPNCESDDLSCSSRANCRPELKIARGSDGTQTVL